MNCPYCGSSDLRVIDSRHVEEDNTIKRRRECESCKKRFSTFEMIQEASIIVIKKDGSREFFDKNKILRGIVRSCQKRPVSTKQMEEIVSDVEKHILNSPDKEVSSNQIGELVISRLKKLDVVSYVRFASVYREFKDVNSFFDELNSIVESEKEL
ncbi:transcriptional regulator NrdR [Peptoanaerobacter stomatis]|uniref:Transcriptional repressor NrdR n=1 Tax=Peptoanaerobacter stomatis TaxID=796937 RepID=J5UFN4_9FIRM|nr:transcriptional regulator NrdR [Peptoanaerobacter stomatis]EHL14609.1 transcriptional regulator NrdR [Peptoanaerobacter stomatis]EJU22149.1 transcriptional regulator NrdR [Peptoanaerobacter stomatis]NWO24893.1 transcriptional repressor NrdR [Peptostreptococcaceae bacterium oral taxon 081]